MPNAENARLEYEAGQTFYPMEALTDSGDATVFTSQADLFSGRSGYTPVIRPDGLETGGAVTASSSNDAVNIAALTCYLAGVQTSVAASTGEVISRPATDVAKVNSITVTSAGAIAVVEGVDGASSTFSETRGAAGGPPYIPVGSIEIAQVRVTSASAAPIASTEIFAVVGVHTERYDYPLPSALNATGSVEFTSALPLIHTGDLPKGVYASYAEPIFADVALASDFKPAETSHSVSSTQVYGTTIGSSSSSLGQGGFKAYLENGVTDALVTLKNETLWFRFSPDRYESAHLLTQGKLGVKRTYPTDKSLMADCTISAATETVERAS